MQSRIMCTLLLSYKIRYILQGIERNCDTSNGSSNR